MLLGQQPGLFLLALWTGEGRPYWHAREGLGFPAYPATIEHDGQGWTLSAGNRQLYSAGLAPGAPGADPFVADAPWIALRCPLAPDWTRGLLGSGPVELGSHRFEPAPMASPRNVADLTTRGDLDGWLGSLGASRPAEAASLGPRGTPAHRTVRELDREGLEAFAFSAHREGALGLPSNISLADARAIEAYRRRKEIRLTGLVIVSVDCVASTEAIERALPPPLAPGTDSVLRVTAIRGLEDPALDEAWLLADCTLDGTQVWYAVSHLRNSVYASAYGREAFGYPTQRGSVGVRLGGNRFSVDVARDGQALYRAWGAYGGFSTGTALDSMTVATLRLGPGLGTGPRPGHLVTQRWRFQGLRRPVVRSSLDAMFPSGDSAAGSAIWNRAGRVHAYWATAMDGAGMQRQPGRVVAEVADVGPYYRERCDGILPWGSSQAEVADQS